MELRHWLVVLPLAAVACSGGGAPEPVADDARAIVDLAFLCGRRAGIWLTTSSKGG